jgi:hypothetical protein
MSKTLTGVIGFFDDAHSLVQATEKARDARYEHFDAYTPYPVHGLEAAQGLRRSPIPYVTFVAGLTGCSVGFLLQYWTSAVDWPLIVGGKPLNSWPAFVPIMFELTVLFAGLATAGAMLLFNGLPNTRRRIFDTSLTRDRFALVIEAPVAAEEEEIDDYAAPRKPADAGFRKFDEQEASQFLRGAGAKDVRSVHAEGWF